MRLVAIAGRKAPTVAAMATVGLAATCWRRGLLRCDSQCAVVLNGPTAASMTAGSKPPNVRAYREGLGQASEGDSDVDTGELRHHYCGRSADIDPLSHRCAHHLSRAAL
jgi:hypothetical protein